MSKYIDADKLIKSVNNYQEGAKSALNPIDGYADYYKGKIDACEDMQEFITYLQPEQPRFPEGKSVVEKVFGAGNLESWEWDEAEMLVLLAKEELLKPIQQAVQLVFDEKLMPFKDGNQWCFLLGHNIQDGVCGFGDTILDAAVDFYREYESTKTNIVELKISLEQPEADLEKEYQEFCKDYPFPWSSQYVNRDYIDELCLSVARHFYELGLNARKEE